MRRARLCSLIVLLGLAAAAPADAQPRGKGSSRTAEPPADIETAEAAYASLDYDKANEIAARVVKQRNLTHDQLVRAYRILAVTDAVLGKEDEARDAFLKLLVSEPEYTVDTNLGPKVSTPFVEARGQFRTLPSKPGVEVVANVRDAGGQLRVTTRDPLHVARRVTVGYRWTSSGEYVVSTASIGQASVEVAAAPSGRTRLDFYAQAVDERDNVVFEAGNPDAPKSSFVDPSSRPAAFPGAGTTPPAEKNGGSVFSSPLFWILTGAAVVGGGVATYFAIREGDTPTQAALVPRLRCGPDPCK